MKKKALVLFVVLCSYFGISQEVLRVKISGRIIANQNDVENVTVYNASSNKGAITNKKGEFTLSMAANDILEISALQFKKIETVVSAEVIETKEITIFLVEQVNKLTEVLVLSAGLTGNLATDLENIKTNNPNLNEQFAAGIDASAYKLPPDYKTGAENTVINNYELQYGADIIGILAFLVKKAIPGKEKAKSETAKNTIHPSVPLVQTLIDKYSVKEISSHFNISEDKVNDFVNYVETSNDFSYLLYNENNEMQLIEFLVQKSKSFLAKKE